MPLARTQAIRRVLRNFIQGTGNKTTEGRELCPSRPGQQARKLSLTISVLGKDHGPRGHHQTIGQLGRRELGENRVGAGQLGFSPLMVLSSEVCSST